MGIQIDREDYDDEDYQRFSLRLQHSLIALRELLGRPGFGEGEPSIGAELEIALVDSNARPLPLNLKVLGETVDPRFTVELDRFNLECNLDPTSLAGRPFGFLRHQIDDALAEVRRAASAHGGRIAVIGILPTLRPGDLQSSAMTDRPRYRILSNALRRIRRELYTAASRLTGAADRTGIVAIREEATRVRKLADMAGLVQTPQHLAYLSAVYHIGWRRCGMPFGI